MRFHDNFALGFSVSTHLIITVHILFDDTQIAQKLSPTDRELCRHGQRKEISGKMVQEKRHKALLSAKILHKLAGVTRSMAYIF